MSTKHSNVGILLLCAVATLLDGYGQQILGLAVPSIAAEFGILPARLAPALSATLVGAAVGGLLLAPLADRFGRRMILLVSMVALGLPSLLIALTSSLGSLVILQFISGLGVGAAVPVATALAAERATAARRAFVVTAVSTGSSLGALLASVGAPQIELASGWRSLFFVGAGLPLAAAVFFVFAKRDVRPQLRSSAGTGSIKALLAPSLRRQTLLLWTTFAMALFATAALASWLPTLLIELGVAKPIAQRMVGLLGLGGLVGGLAFGYIVDKVKSYGPLPVAFFVASAAALSIFWLPHQSVLALACAIFVIGVGMIGPLNVLGALSARIYAGDIRSTGLGWMGGVGRLLSIFGPLTIGYLLLLGLPAAVILMTFSVPTTICAIAALRLTRGLSTIDED